MKLSTYGLLSVPHSAILVGIQTLGLKRIEDGRLEPLPTARRRPQTPSAQVNR